MTIASSSGVPYFYAMSTSAPVVLAWGRGSYAFLRRYEPIMT